MNRTILMAFVLAGGILASSAVSLLAADALVWAVAAPLVMAAALFLALQAGPGGPADKRALRVRAAILAGSVLVASFLVIRADPGRLKVIMPILGAAAAAPLLSAARNRSR